MPTTDAFEEIPAMKHSNTLSALWCAACIGLACTASALATPVGTSFTYQGSLTQSGTPVNGAVPMEFRLFDASTDGNQVGPTLGGAIDVADGLFTASLDFGVGSYAVNQALWLEITVDGDLLGRQQLEATPFALNTRGFSVSQSGQVEIGPVNTFGGTRIDGVAPHSLELRSSGEPRFEIGIADDTGHYNVSAGQFDTVIRNLEIDSRMLFATGELTSPIMTLDGSMKRVGIGTAAPQRTMHIRSIEGNGDPLRVERLGSVSYISLKSFPNSQFSLPTADWFIGARDNGTAPQGGQFIIDTPGGDPAPKLVVDGATNNVGFNTPLGAQPQARLDVSSIGNGTQNVMAFSPENVPQFFLQTNMDGNQGIIDSMYLARGSDGFKIITWNVSGRVGIGVTDPSTALEVNGQVCATGYNCPSSRDLKRDILNLGDALGLIDRLRPVSYTWNEQATDSKQGIEDIGFIAEEVAEILPSVVSSNDDGKVIGMDYSKLTPVAIQAIKELKAENDELKARLDRLEASLER